MLNPRPHHRGSCRPPPAQVDDIAQPESTPFREEEKNNKEEAARLVSRTSAHLNCRAAVHGGNTTPKRKEERHETGWDSFKDIDPLLNYIKGGKEEGEDKTGKCDRLIIVAFSYPGRRSSLSARQIVNWDKESVGGRKEEGFIDTTTHTISIKIKWNKFEEKGKRGVLCCFVTSFYDVI